MSHRLDDLDVNLKKLGGHVNSQSDHVWREMPAGNLKGFIASHSSLVPMDVAGQIKARLKAGSAGRMLVFEC